MYNNNKYINLYKDKYTFFEKLKELISIKFFDVINLTIKIFSKVVQRTFGEISKKFLPFKNLKKFAQKDSLRITQKTFGTQEYYRIFISLLFEN